MCVILIDEADDEREHYEQFVIEHDENLVDANDINDEIPLVILDDDEVDEHDESDKQQVPENHEIDEYEYWAIFHEKIVIMHDEVEHEHLVVHHLVGDMDDADDDEIDEHIEVIDVMLLIIDDDDDEVEAVIVADEVDIND